MKDHPLGQPKYVTASLRPETVLCLLLVAVALLPRLATLSLGTDVDTACYTLLVRSMSKSGLLLYREIYCKLTPLLFYLGKLLYAPAPGHFTILTRIVMVVLTSSCVVPIYHIGRRLFGPRAAIFASLFYAFDLLNIFYARNLHVSTLEGVAAAWTLYIFVLALAASRRRPLLVSLAGAAAATAFLTKQSSAILAPAFFLLSLIFAPDLQARPSPRRALRDLAPFLAGYLLALLPWFLYFAAKGLLPDVWHSLVVINFQLRSQGTHHAPTGTAAAKLHMLAEALSAVPWTWLAATLGCAIMLRLRQWRVLISLVICAGYAAFLFLVYYESHPHYLLPWMPPLALIAGYAATKTISAVQENLLRTQPSRQTALACGIAALAALALAANLLQRHRGHLASFAFAAVLLLLKTIAYSHATRSARNTFPKLARPALIIFLAASVLLAYWSRRYIYWIPTISLAQERQVATWINGQRAPADDIILIGPNALSIHGRWRQLPFIANDRPIIGPMMITNALRPWSPDAENLAHSILLWERDYSPRFIIARDDYWRTVNTPQAAPLRNYVLNHFQPVKTFAWPEVDPTEYIHIFERAPTSKQSPPPSPPTAPHPPATPGP